MIEQKRIAYIVGLAAMAPVVAGARLGEDADALARVVRRAVARRHRTLRAVTSHRGGFRKRVFAIDGEQCP